MQRRAAAAYFVLFMVIGAGAYAYIGMAERPNVDIDGETYAVDDELTVDDRTYTVDSISNGSGELTWTKANAQYTATLENNSTVSWQAISWEGQAVDTATLENGATIQYNGSIHEIQLNASADPPTVRLVRVDNRSINETFEQGGEITLRLDGQLFLGATITEVTDQEATIGLSDDYRVVIANATDPDSADLVQDLNVTRRLRADARLYNQTVTIDGTKYVTYRTNDTNRRLDTYLEDPDIETLDEGDTVRFEGNETTVGNITREAVPLNWQDVRVNSVELSEGSVVDLNNESFLVHFPDDASVQIVENTSENYAAYQADQKSIDKYHERKAGLWGVVIMSFMAAMLLLGTAYLPVKD